MNGPQILIKVLFFLCTHYKQMLIKADCGLPAIPDSTKLSSFRPRYEEQTTVTYECEAKNSELIEGKHRQCINHRWKGSLPRCALEVRKVVLRSIYIEELGKHRSVYRQILARSINRKSDNRVHNGTEHFECVQPRYLWNIYGNQTWTFQLTRGYTFNYFVLYIKGEFLLENKNDDNLTLKASIEDTVSSKSCEVRQFSLTDDAITYKIGFICNSVQQPVTIHEGIDETVQRLIIKVYTKQLNVTVTFCSLKVYRISNFCGSPEKPLNSHLLAQEKTYSVFSCKEGYYIEGVQKVKCSPNGKWLTEFPICIPKTKCKIPAIDREDPFLQIEYKYTYKVNGSLYAEPDGIAIYACVNMTDGTQMEFKGETSRICKDGKWSGSQPTCHNSKNATPMEMSFYFEPTQITPQNNQTSSKLITVIVAMLGSFVVGGISVAIVIYLIIRRRERYGKRSNVSIVINENNGLEEYSTLRVSQCSNFSNEIINPLYEDLNKHDTPLNILAQSSN